MDQKIVDYFKKDSFASDNGIILSDCQKGYAEAKMLITDRHRNAAGVVHGGAIFTLADFAFAAAVNSHGMVALAINASVSFFKKGLEGTITAEAMEISRNSKLATYDVSVMDEDEELIANFKGTAYITKQINKELS